MLLECLLNFKFDLVFSRSCRNFKEVRENRNKGLNDFHERSPKGDRGGMDCQKGAIKVDVFLRFFNKLLKE
jgi:hypothetical protein